MTISEEQEEDNNLAQFLESEILSDVSDQAEKEKVEEEPKAKRVRFHVDEIEKKPKNDDVDNDTDNVSNNNNNNNSNPMRIESGVFSKIPTEIFPHILKFLSSEDLVACALVCRCLNYAASDESLWRRLYFMRWGPLSSTKYSLEHHWKKLYLKRDEEDIFYLVRSCPPEFKEYYIQMQAAKRSQAPLPSQIKDDQTVLDKTVAEQVALWKGSKGLADKVFKDHACSGNTCSYHQIGDAFVCEKTGNVHVCDGTCTEVLADPSDGQLVCTISGRCFGSLLASSDAEEDSDQQLGGGGVTDEQEPFMGSGRFARAYLLGYNCDDEKELESALRFC